MLFIVFHMGKDRYAIPASDVVEVLPLMELKLMPKSPAGVAGLFNFHGTPVPVVDLNLIACGTPSATSMTTRLAVVQFAVGDGEFRYLALMVEHLTDTLRADESAFLPSAIKPEGAPYLGPVFPDGAAFIQRIEVAALLPPEVRSILFTDEPRLETP